MSFKRSINFNRVQNVSIRRSSSADEGLQMLWFADEDLQIETFCTALEAHKLPLHLDHTVVNLYSIIIMIYVGFTNITQALILLCCSSVVRVFSTYPSLFHSLGYLCNVLAALGQNPTQDLKDLEILLKADRKKFVCLDCVCI